MHTTDTGPRHRRLKRATTGTLLVAPLAAAVLAAAAPPASSTSNQNIATAAAVDVSATTCANCHQTLNHQAPLSSPGTTIATSDNLHVARPPTARSTDVRPPQLLGEDDPLETAPASGG
jgi:hypothetical protein